MSQCKNFESEDDYDKYSLYVHGTPYHGCNSKERKARSNKVSNSENKV